jgi:hypothetical protein
MKFCRFSHELKRKQGLEEMCGDVVALGKCMHATELGSWGAARKWVQMAGQTKQRQIP